MSQNFNVAREDRREARRLLDTARRSGIDTSDLDAILDRLDDLAIEARRLLDDPANDLDILDERTA